MYTITWSQRNTAAYPGAAGKLVATGETNLALAEADAVKSMMTEGGIPAVAFCNSAFSPTNPASLPNDLPANYISLYLQAQSAVVISGEIRPLSGSGCTTYLLEPQPRNIVFESDMLQTPGLTGEAYLTPADFANIASSKFTHFFAGFCHINWQVSANIVNQSAGQLVYEWRDPKSQTFTVEAAQAFEYSQIYATRTPVQVRCYPAGSKWDEGTDLTTELQSGTVPVLNGPTALTDPILSAHFNACAGLQWGVSPKIALLSIGGWNSSSWQTLTGDNDSESDQYAQQAAAQVAAFIRSSGFDGVDINFEGDYGTKQEYLDSFGRFFYYLRQQLPGSFLTITPIFDQAEAQIRAIDAMARQIAPSTLWTQLISWINLQLYTYNNANAEPISLDHLESTYEKVVGKTITAQTITADRVTAGFPLEGSDASKYSTFDPAEVKAAMQAVSALMNANSNLAGAFVWRYQFTKFLAQSGFDWATGIDTALHPSNTNPSPAAPTSLHVVAS